MAKVKVFVHFVHTLEADVDTDSRAMALAFRIYCPGSALFKKRDYQESLTTRQTHTQTPDKIIPMCHYA